MGQTYLDDGFLAADLENLTATHGAIGKGQLNDLVVRGELGISKSRCGELTDTLSSTTRGLVVSSDMVSYAPIDSSDGAVV